MAASAYALIFVVWFVVASGFAAVGLHPLAMAMFPVPIALYWAVGMPGRSLGLVAGAGVAAGFATGSPALVGLYVAIADLGVLIGVACTRRWSYGWTVAMVTVLGFSLMAVMITAGWEAWQKDATIVINARIADLEKDTAPGTASDVVAAMVEVLRWVDLNWRFLSLGMLFASALLMVSVILSFIVARLRRVGADTVRGCFSDARTPEWLVWLAIVLALMWFVDKRWPNDILRLITWNSAVGLAFVYWMNGFSILIYVMSVFKVATFLFYAVIVGMFYLNLLPVLFPVGFFDTWWDFRKRAARAAEARFSRPPEDKEP
jgi:hypothetical protein